MNFLDKIKNILKPEQKNKKFHSFKKDKTLVPFGLDISGGSIKALRLEKTEKEKIKIKDAGYFKLYDTIIDLGLIKNKDEVKKIIFDFLKDKDLGNSPIINVPEAQNFVLNFKIPKKENIDKENKEKFIINYAQREIPYPLSETYYDYKIYKSDKNFEYLVFVASPKVIIDDYIKILNSLNLYPSVFELESEASFRAVKKYIKDQSSNILIINIGYNLTNINIFFENIIETVSYIPYGSQHIDHMIAKHLSEEARTITFKRKKEGLNSDNKDFRNLLKKELNYHIIKNISTAIEYFSKREKKDNIRFHYLVLLGGFSITPGLKEYFENFLSTKVIIPDVFKINNIKIDKNKFDFILKNKLSFSQALGLALRGLEKDFISSDLNIILRLQPPF